MPYKSRWTIEQKIGIVMESLNTNISVAELCRKHNVTPNAFYGWKDKFLDAGKLALAGSLKTGHGDELAAENESRVQGTARRHQSTFGPLKDLALLKAQMCL
ncbi:MAG: transposase [Nitrososphaerales archaeon]